MGMGHSFLLLFNISCVTHCLLELCGFCIKPISMKEYTRQQGILFVSFCLQGAKLRSLPPILTISLLRFSYDFVKLERFKETGHYTFPLELDMAPYCEQVSIRFICTIELQGVLNNFGFFFMFTKRLGDSERQGIVFS